MSALFYQNVIPQENQSIRVNDAVIRGHATIAEYATVGGSLTAAGALSVGSSITHDNIPAANLIQGTSISTAIDAVRTGFGTSNEQVHRSLTLDQCETHIQAGEFPAGSMGPKIGSLMEAALHQPGLQAVLCQPGEALDALRGKAGTTIVV